MPRSEVKKTEGRIRISGHKIKQLIPQPKNIQVKKEGKVVRRMTVRSKTIYPTQRENIQY